MAQEKQPAIPAEGSAAEPNDNASETTPDEGSGEDFAGYKDLNEMRSAVYASRKEGKRLAEQNVQLAGYLARLVKTEAKEPSNGADELSELGIPVDALQRVVREAVQAEMAPMGRTQEAINTVRATHPGFAKSEADFNRWLGANPDVVSTYNQAVADPKLPQGAAEYLLKGVFAEYESSRHPDSGQQQKKVSSDAKIPASRGGGSVRKDPADNVSRDEMKELVKDARRSGSPVEIMRALLNGKSIHRDIEAQKR